MSIRDLSILPASLAFLALVACATAQKSSSDASRPAPSAESPAPTDAASNPLLATWTGPYGGVPPLDRVGRIYSVWSSTMSSKDFQAVERDAAPKIAAHIDRIFQNEALFKRLDAVYTSPELKKLTPEQQRLAWRKHTDFVRAGARL